MTVLNAIKLIKQNKVKTEKDLRKLFKLRQISSGLFRKAYKLVGLNLVVKVPRTGTTEGLKNCKDHSNNEVRIINEILTNSKYKTIKEYMPKVYYHCKQTGLIIMKKYQTHDYNDQYDETVVDEIMEKVSKVISGTGDCHYGNFGYETIKGKQKYVMIDLGYITLVL